MFNKAIIESGTPSTHTKSMAKICADLFLKHLELKPENIEQLIDMDPEKTKKAITEGQREYYKKYPGASIPGIEVDDLLPEDALLAIIKGFASDKKIIIGTNKDESTLFYKFKMMPVTWEEIKHGYIENGYEDIFKEVFKFYTNEKPMGQWHTDKYFLINSIIFAQEQSKYNDVWMYQFNASSDIMKKIGLNAMHSAEMPFVFGTTDTNSPENAMWKGTPQEFITKLTKEIHTYWVNFIKSGNPNGDLKNTWTKYDKEQDNIMIFNENSKMENRDYKKQISLLKDTKFYNEAK